MEHTKEMTSHKLHYVEDYIQFIAGIHDRNMRLFFGPSPISLARYDVQIVSSLAEQAAGHISFTDKQAALSHKIVVKYKRQFAKIGIDITDVEVNPEYRYGMRIVDRTKLLTVNCDQIIMRFPYDKAIIDLVSSVAKEHHGSMSYNKDKRIWEISPTDINISAMYIIAKNHGFTVDQEILDVVSEIERVENAGYTIELVWDKETDQISITNAEDSLIDYINEHLGGLTVENLTVLADNAGYLGYTVSEPVEYYLSVLHGRVNTMLIENRKAQLTVAPGHRVSNSELLSKVYNYAKLTNRWPVYVYTNPGEFDLEDVFGKDNVLGINNISDNVSLSGKCVKLNTLLRRTWNKKIPLFVTSNATATSGMSAQLDLLAEKVVYLTNTTFNDQIKKILI